MYEVYLRNLDKKNEIRVKKKLKDLGRNEISFRRICKLVNRRSYYGIG